MVYLNQWEIFRGISWHITLVVNLLRTTIDKGAANPGCPHASPSPPQELVLCSCWRACWASPCMGRRERGLSYKYTLWVMSHKANTSKIKYLLFRCWQPWQSIRVGERNRSGMLLGLLGFLPCPIRCLRHCSNGLVPRLISDLRVAQLSPAGVRGGWGMRTLLGCLWLPLCR